MKKKEEKQTVNSGRPDPAAISVMDKEEVLEAKMPKKRKIGRTGKKKEKENGPRQNKKEKRKETNKKA